MLGTGESGGSLPPYGLGWGLRVSRLSVPGYAGGARPFVTAQKAGARTWEPEAGGSVWARSGEALPGCFEDSGQGVGAKQNLGAQAGRGSSRL